MGLLKESILKFCQHNNYLQTDFRMFNTWYIFFYPSKYFDLSRSLARTKATELLLLFKIIG
jgi:hypothetical protein